METIVRARFGSHLYGTSTPESDTDFKSVHVPGAHDIILQRVQGVVSSSTKSDLTRKNDADDVDDASFALHKFLGLVAKGDMMATELMFAPGWSWLKTSDSWHLILSMKDRIINRRCDGFVGYCRKQASRYGIRGSRVRTARDALALLERHRGSTKVGDLRPEIEDFVGSHEHTSILDLPAKGIAGTLLHWEVCDRKLPFSVRAAEARLIVQKIVDSFGSRSLAAERNQGVDWKSLAHAVRVAEQSLELFETGTITFPRPNAERLLQIKRGDLPYSFVGENLEALLDAVEVASDASDLPDDSNQQVIDDLVLHFYGRAIRQERTTLSGTRPP